MWFHNWRRFFKYNDKTHFKIGIQPRHRRLHRRFAAILLAQLHWSSNIYNMMPFVASMVILAFTSKNSMAPKAEGIPYDKGSR